MKGHDRNENGVIGESGEEGLIQDYRVIEIDFAGQKREITITTKGDGTKILTLPCGDGTVEEINIKPGWRATTAIIQDFHIRKNQLSENRFGNVQIKAMETVTPTATVTAKPPSSGNGGLASGLAERLPKNVETLLALLGLGGMAAGAAGILLNRKRKGNFNQEGVK